MRITRLVLDLFDVAMEVIRDTPVIIFNIKNGFITEFLSRIIGIINGSELCQCRVENLYILIIEINRITA